MAKIVDGKPVLARDRSTVTTYRMRTARSGPPGLRQAPTHPAVAARVAAGGNGGQRGHRQRARTGDRAAHATSELSVDERVAQLRVVEWSSYQASTP